MGATGPAGERLGAPAGIAIDPRDGNVYVSDQSNERIEEVSPTGAFIKTFGWGVKDGKDEFEDCTKECKAGIAGAGAGEFDQVGGLAIDSSGNVWVADTGNDRIQEFNEQGQFVNKFGSAGSEPGSSRAPPRSRSQKGTCT